MVRAGIQHGSTARHLLVGLFVVMSFITMPLFTHAVYGGPCTTATGATGRLDVNPRTGESRCVADGVVEEQSGTGEGSTTRTVDQTTDVVTTTVRDNEGNVTSETSAQGFDVVNAVGNGLLATVLSPIAIVSFLVLTFSSFLLWLAGALFNWSVAYLVFDFATWFGNSPGLLLAWRILRDFGNIILLYGFVYMGIATILDLHNYTVKKALPNLVIFAVLLNFSLFVTEAIIDTSNVLASTMYNQTYAEECTEGSRETCLRNDGISSQILQQAGIGAVFGSGSLDGQQTGLVQSDLGGYIAHPVGETLKYLGLALLVSIAAVVLFAGALLLIARAIHLGMLMVTSPIGFAGMAVPPLQKIAKDWWGQLINQALFAPVFLLLLFVALKITEGLQVVGNNQNGGLGYAISRGGANDTGPILLFALVIGFMIAALLMAKRFGVYGADFAIKAAGGAVYGTMGFVGRRTIGAASNRIAGNIRNSRFGTTILGDRLARIADIGAKSSLDARGAGVFKTVTKEVGVDFGTTSKIGKDGRRGELKAAAKEYGEAAKAIADERKARDGKITGKMSDLQYESDVMRARARQAEMRGDSASASEYEQKAGKLDGKRAEAEAELELNKRKRLSDDDRALLGYYKDAGKATPIQREEEARAVADTARANTVLTNAETSLKLAEDGLRAATERLDRAKDKQLAPDASEEDRAAHQKEIDDARADRLILETRRNTLATERATALKKRDEFKAKSDKFTKDRTEAGEKAAKAMLDPKYAMEQFARTLDRTSQRIEGAMLDAAKLRAGAKEIRKEGGKSEADSAWDHLRHTLEHGKDHGDDHGKGGGGGGKPKKAASGGHDDHGGDHGHG